jgi:hydrogenase nickel incorporation protein HypA/HybF
MHESSLARQLLTEVLRQASASEAKRVLAVRGWLAETEALNRDAIEFHFGALAKGTAAESATLNLVLIHVAARCSACDKTYKPEHHLTLCPSCGSTDGELLGPTGFGLESIDVD